MFTRLCTFLIVPLVALSIFLFLKGDADLPLFFANVKGEYFKDKVVILTGASSGLGEYFAYELCNFDAKLVLVARREEKLQQVAAKCASAHKPIIFPLDLTEEDKHDELIQATLTAFGQIDMVVLNAGISQRSTADDTEMTATRRIMELNFFSTVALTRKVLPLFLKQQSGDFVVVSSLAGKIGNPIGTSYSASKYALHGYFDGLRSEVSGDGIGVRMICPGPVQSEISAHAYKGSKDEELKGQGDSGESEEKKMDTDRFALLMAAAVSNQYDEVWISPQPLLLFTYFNQYAPKLWRDVMKVVGPARVRVFKNGGDIYDMPAVLNEVKQGFTKN